MKVVSPNILFVTPNRRADDHGDDGRAHGDALDHEDRGQEIADRPATTRCIHIAIGAADISQQKTATLRLRSPRDSVFCVAGLQPGQHVLIVDHPVGNQIGQGIPVIGRRRTERPDPDESDAGY